MFIDVGEFLLETFEEDNLKHVYLLQELINGSKSSFIHCIEERLCQGQSFKSFPFGSGLVVTLKESLEAIGYLYISNQRKDEIFLEYSLAKQYQGKKLGSMLLNSISEYLFFHYNLKDICLDIDPSNEASIRTALSASYYPDEDEYLCRHLEGKIIYRRDNYDYVSKKKR